jgi:hypothetical protein
VTTAGTRGRWAALVSVALLSLLSHLPAALPGKTYYFRDFSVTFYPQRAFQAAEWMAGRWPSWNPYLNQGTFAIPALYPLDLLHRLWSGPAAVSWLLTLQFPIAGLACYALARGMGASRTGAVVSGAAYALGGLAVSSLNLYLFLQALALAPAVALCLRRAGLSGGRDVVVAAILVAASMATLAVEFVAQAVLLGFVLAVAESAAPRTILRVLAAILLGVGLAALPLLVVASLLPETVRGQGFDRSVALGNELHPFVALQMLVPNLFGRLSAPAELWWGGRFFTKGFPYFLSLYVGPLLPGFAALGLAALPRRLRWLLVAACVGGVCYALGARAGLAPLLAPLLKSFRFPVKALLTPYLVAAFLVGLGLDRLRRGEGWRALAGITGAACAVAMITGVALQQWGERVVAWMGVDAGWTPLVRQQVTADAFRVAAVAGAGLALAALVLLRRARAAWASVAVAGLLIADLAWAGMGIDPQVPVAFFDPLPEMRALHLNELGGGRVFTYGLDESPAYRAFLSARPPGLGLWSFFINRQMLAPYNNVIDRVELYDGKDLTSFGTRAPEVGPAEYAPGRVADLLDRWRTAAVTRVLSLDPLAHPELRLLVTIPTGVPALQIHVYELNDSLPRAYVACHVLAEDALLRDPARDVALAEGKATCRTGSAVRTAWAPPAVDYDVEADGDAYLVTRDTFATGWRAEVDGVAAPVLRANGQHRAVPFAAGRHRVSFRYEAPGRRWGMALTLVSVAVAMAVWRRASPASV